MPRTSRTDKVRKPQSRRKRVAKGVYRDRYGLSATVKVGTGADAIQREKRFPFDTPLGELKTWRDTMRSDLRTARNQRPAHAMRGTLEADAKLYLAQVRHLTSFKSRRCEVTAWTKLYGRLRRTHLTATQVREARARWLDEGYTPKTVNNRVQTLRHVYRLLDGKRAPTPVDEVDPLTVPVQTKHNVSPTVFLTVATNLAIDPKTRARFMVIASTGVRPSELKRAEPGDVDLERRVWMVKTGKGGDPRAFWLNDDMLAAWQAFLSADAWGAFDGSDYAKALYAAGWPTHIRPYQARHSVGIELSERGVDLGDVQGWLGHKHIATTRKHYVGVLPSRLKQASERLDGRFGWEALPSPAGQTGAIH